MYACYASVSPFANGSGNMQQNKQVSWVVER